MHETARAFEPHQHFVLGPGVRQYRRHLLAKRRYRAGADVALEVEHEDPGTVRPGALLAGLRLALAIFRRRLARLAAQQPALQSAFHFVVAGPEIAHFEPLGAAARAPPRGEHRDEENQGGNGRGDGQRLGQKQSVLPQIVEHRAGSHAVRIGADLATAPEPGTRNGAARQDRFLVVSGAGGPGRTGSQERFAAPRCLVRQVLRPRRTLRSAVLQRSPGAGRLSRNGYPSVGGTAAWRRSCSASSALVATRSCTRWCGSR